MIKRSVFLRAMAVVVLALLMIACCCQAQQVQTTTGSKHIFRAVTDAAGNVSYQWNITDGSPLSGSGQTFPWTAPAVNAPLHVTVRLVVLVENGCPTFKDMEFVVNPPGYGTVPRIDLVKGCNFTEPVRVGDYVTYTYNVTNTGGVPLISVNLTDVQEWGTPVDPVYVWGDNGDGILDPGESWHYEARYRIPNPDDYRLSIMAAGIDSRKMLDLTKSLLDMKARLELKIEDMRRDVDRFDTSRAELTTKERRIRGVSYTLYNYTDPITDASYSIMKDGSGRAVSSDYIDPITDAILTIEYLPSGKMKAETYYSPKTREYMKIELDTPAKGFKAYTIIDRSTGDTLILAVDPSGAVLSMEYRKTPGLRVFEARVFARNTATVRAIDVLGNREVTASDSFSLEILKMLPALSVSKAADPDPVIAGQTLNYTIKYENIGGEDAHDVLITETFDKNVTFKYANPAPDSGTVNKWTIGDLPKGVSGQIFVVVDVKKDVDAGTVLTNVVNATCREKMDAWAIVNTTVVSNRLNITKTASNDVVGNGSTLVYTISYVNEANTTAKNVTIHDYLDPWIVSATSIPVETIRDGNHLIWFIGDLPGGAKRTITITAELSDSLGPDVKKIENRYRIESDWWNETNKTLETYVVHSLWIKKFAAKQTYARGDTAKYTIYFGNNDKKRTATDITIIDKLPDVPIDNIEVYPQPAIIKAKTLIWHFDKLEPGESGMITLLVVIPKKSLMVFDETSSVTGDGYVYIRKDLVTGDEQGKLVNYAEINGTFNGVEYFKQSSSATILIAGATGTSISTDEHGSGYFDEKEYSTVRTENKSVSLRKETYARFNQSTMSLPRGRNISYRSMWSDRSRIRNYAKADSLSEEYHYMQSIGKNSSFIADPNQTVYRTSAEFSGGIGRMDYSSGEEREEGSGIDQGAVTEFSESYHGSFSVEQTVDAYGSDPAYTKSAKGIGFVSTDKEAGYTKTYERGSGYYKSDEIFESPLVKKDLKAVYQPSNLTAFGRLINYSSKWHEGMSTADQGKKTSISEEITSAQSIKKESEMGRSYISILGEFNGTMDLMAAKGPRRHEVVRVEQRLSGDYEMDTAISIYETPKHLFPSVNVTKKAYKVDDETMLYVINVTNDGNKMLKPVNVTDKLPTGVKFINATVRPKVKGQRLNWTIKALEISRMVSIKLYVKINETNDYLTNIVNVTATHPGGVVTDNASCSMVFDWLPCCFGAILDAENVTAVSTNKSINESFYYDSTQKWLPKCFNLSSGEISCDADIDEYYKKLEKDSCEVCV